MHGQNAMILCMVMVALSYHDAMHGQKYPAMIRCMVMVTVSYRDPDHDQKDPAMIQCMVKSILPLSGAL